MRPEKSTRSRSLSLEFVLFFEFSNLIFFVPILYPLRFAQPSFVGTAGHRFPLSSTTDSPAKMERLKSLEKRNKIFKRQIKQMGEEIDKRSESDLIDDFPGPSTRGEQEQVGSGDRVMFCSNIAE